MAIKTIATHALAFSLGVLVIAAGLVVQPKVSAQEPVLRIENGTRSTGNVINLDTGISAKYEPQPDITAYELSQIIPFLLGKMLTQAEWDKLGEAQRHLKRIQ